MIRFRDYIPYDLYLIIKWMGIGTLFWWFTIGIQPGDTAGAAFIIGIIIGPFFSWFMLAPLYYAVKFQKQDNERWEATREQRELAEHRHREWVAKKKASNERLRIEREKRNAEREERARTENERYRRMERDG